MHIASDSYVVHRSSQPPSIALDRLSEMMQHPGTGASVVVVVHVQSASSPAIQWQLDIRSQCVLVVVPEPAQRAANRLADPAQHPVASVVVNVQSEGSSVAIQLQPVILPQCISSLAMAQCDEAWYVVPAQQPGSTVVVHVQSAYSPGDHVHWLMRSQ